MEGSYYSSDEEIAWGPLTLREIRKEFAEEPRKIKRRETDSGRCAFFTPSTTFSDEKTDEDKINNSGTSAYFTPDESLQPEKTQNKNDLFLEKLTEVIGSEDSFKLDTTEPHCDTLSNILDGEDDAGLDSFQQTLVENTIRLSVGDKEKIFSVSSEEMSDCSKDSTNVIVISDDDDDSVIETQREECRSLSPSSVVKVENTLTENCDYEEVNMNEKSYCSTISQPESQNDRSYTDYEDSFSMERKEETQTDSSCEIEEIQHLNTDNEDSFSLSEDRRDDQQKTQIDSCVERSLDANRLNISGISCLSSGQAPSSMQENSAGDSLCIFNDTMEEMEMALRQGLDYVMPGDITPIHERSPMVTSQKTGIPKLKKPQKTPNKYHYVQSPVGDYIRKKSPQNDNFKLPLKPVKIKSAGNSRSPLLQTNQFKSIISPIGVYIKNSPGVCLKQNVLVRTLPMLKSPVVPSELIKDNKENNHMGLPEVIYKPRKKIVTSAKKDIKLPSSLQKMVQEPVIMSHEGRHRKDVNKSEIREKLLKEDLTTCDSTLLDETGEDYSFVNIKQAFIK